MRHESIPIGTACSRETAQRAEVALLCEVRQGFDPWRLVRLEDISQSGFRIAWLPDATQLKPLRIRIPGLAMPDALIRSTQTFVNRQPLRVARLRRFGRTTRRRCGVGLFHSRNPFWTWNKPAAPAAT